MRAKAITCALIFLHGEAAASAWPQQDGHAFLSLGYEVAVPRDELRADADDPAPEFEGYRTVYFEYGLTPRLTVGLDYGGIETNITGIVNDEMERLAKQQGYTSEQLAALDATDQPVIATWSGIAFLRAAIGPLDARHRFAVQLGFGQRHYEQKGLYYGLEEMKTETILRPAVAYGYGFGGARVSGWAGLEASVEFREHTSGEPKKLDAILGLRLGEASRLAYLLALQSGDFPGSDPYAKLLPGVVVRVWRNLSVESSLIWGVAGDRTVGARIGLWVEF
ncbi:MAG: hypothetical protein KDA73_04220 [Rhodobacteraceae bacterium]|nr:hypothetical protein [Paracoccaceae bacterium]